MSHQPLPAPTPPATCPPIWPGLPSDVQQRAVRLLAQLAYAQFRQHHFLATQETCHGHCAQQPQGSPRSP
jgi:hypothetical protein